MPSLEWSCNLIPAWAVLARLCLLLWPDVLFAIVDVLTLRTPGWEIHPPSVGLASVRSLGYIYITDLFVMLERHDCLIATCLCCASSLCYWCQRVLSVKVEVVKLEKKSIEWQTLLQENITQTVSRAPQWAAGCVGRGWWHCHVLLTFHSLNLKSEQHTSSPLRGHPKVFHFASVWTCHLFCFQPKYSRTFRLELSCISFVYVETTYSECETFWHDVLSDSTAGTANAQRTERRGTERAG